MSLGGIGAHGEQMHAAALAGQSMTPRHPSATSAFDFRKVPLGHLIEEYTEVRLGLSARQLPSLRKTPAARALSMKDV